MVFEDAPAAFDRVVLGVVRRGVGQAYGQPGLLDEFDPAGHELGSTAVALGAVVEVKEQRIHLRKAVPRPRQKVSRPSAKQSLVTFVVTAKR